MQARGIPPGALDLRRAAARAVLTVRDSLVQARAGVVNLALAILSREGLHVPTGSNGCFSERVEQMGLPPQLLAEIAPLRAMLMPLNEQNGLLDQKLSELGRKDERVKPPMTTPGGEGFRHPTGRYMTKAGTARRGPRAGSPGPSLTEELP